MDKRERVVFILEIKTGVSFKVKNYTEAVRWTGASSKGAVSNAIRSGYVIKGRYAFKNEKFTREEKLKYFNKYWEDNKHELLCEKWATIAPGIKVSSLGRVKTDNKFRFPILANNNNTIRLYYNNKAYNIPRVVMEVYSLKRPLKRHEMVFRDISIFDYDINSLKLGTIDDYQKRGRRSRSQEVAKVDQNGEIIEIYRSMREAGRKNFIDFSTIAIAIKNDRECLGMKFIKMTY